MGEWRVYKIYLISDGGWMYGVGRKIDEKGSLDGSNMEWNHFSKDQDECIQHAKELNGRQNGQTE